MRSLDRVAALVWLSLLSSVACSSGGGESMADFYVPPEPLPADSPGTLIRAQSVEPFSDDLRAWRVLYVSEAVDGTPVAVSGLVAAPVGEPPEGGRGVVSWGHGTTGIMDPCAPSRGYRTDFHDFYDVAAEVVAAGYVAVGTDYEGLGTPGIHPYVVGPSEGRGMLDIARAARQIDEAGASNEVVVWGASQGGHAALFAGEIAPTWAPELDVLGVIAAAPASELKANLGAAALLANTRGFFWQISLGYDAAYEELSVEDLFPDDMLELIQTLVDAEACSDEFSEVGKTPEGGAPVTNPTQLVDWAERLDENSPGHVSSDAPILLIQGDDDQIVPIVLTNVLANRLCDVGSQSDYRVFEGYGHDDASRRNMALMLEWTAARFSGQPAASTCE